MIELRLGRWQDVLADVTRCALLVTDPPYSSKTHAASDDLPEGRQAFAYEPLTPEGACEIVDAWAPRCSRWIAVMTDDVLAPAFRARAASHGLYDFAPVPILYRSGVRIQGDGPASCAIYLVVARPKTREAQRWRSTPGFYEARRRKMPGVLGSKDEDLCRAVIRDYSNPGDLVVDICAGAATFLRAAGIELRDAIGAERDPATCEIGRAELARGYTVSAFAAEPRGLRAGKTLDFFTDNTRGRT